MQTPSNAFSVSVPPQPTGESPDGSRIDINTSGTVTDSTGAKWTPMPQINGAAGQIGLARNGVRVAQSIDFLLYKGRVIYNQDFASGSGYEKWINGNPGNWTPSAAP